MHDVDYTTIMDDIAKLRGGVRRCFDAPDPARTAHLIVDLQNGFMEPGAPVEVPAARDIVDNVNRISRAVRAAGATNVFLRYTGDASGDADWPVMAAMLGDKARSHFSGFAAGEHYWQLWPELDTDPGDLYVDKTRFGAFIPGTCTLHEELQARGLDTLIITGTLSNCCCESTARDAMQLNYKVLFITDGNAAPSDAEHAATVHTMGWLFGDLYSTDEIVELLAAPTEQRMVGAS